MSDPCQPVPSVPGVVIVQPTTAAPDPADLQVVPDPDPSALAPAVVAPIPPVDQQIEPSVPGDVIIS